MKQTIILIWISFLLGGCTQMLVKPALKSIFTEMDRNKDESISYNEYCAMGDKEPDFRKEDIKESKKQGISLEAYRRSEYSKVDLNKDGKVVWEEFYNSATVE